MESEDLQKLVRECPLLIGMNDGRGYFVEKPEFIHVGDYAAGLLIDDNGVKRNAVASLINIASVIPNAVPPKRKSRRKTS
jgi:hypothetical protein